MNNSNLIFWCWGLHCPATLFQQNVRLTIPGVEEKLPGQNLAITRDIAETASLGYGWVCHLSNWLLYELVSLHLECVQYSRLIIIWLQWSGTINISVQPSVPAVSMWIICWCMIRKLIKSWKSSIKTQRMILLAAILT